MSGGMPHWPSGGGSIAPPILPSPPLIISIKALRSSARAIARRISGLSNGGASRLTSKLVVPFVVRNSQIACGAWLLMSFNSGTEMLNGQVTSNCPATKPRIAVERFGTIVYSMPQAICELRTTNGTTNLLVNRDAPPFDNPEIRRAMALALDRKAFIDIISGGEGKIGGAMLPPPEGQWGMPPDMLHTIPGYGPDIGKNRAEARTIMEK